MQNGRINPPSLDLACPHAKTELGKHDHMFMEWIVDKQNTDRSITLTKAQIIIDSNFPLYNLTYNKQRESQ
jgi:hypothetical protein